MGKSGLLAIAVIILAGCSVQGGTMAPVEDRTGNNSSANYGNRVIEQPNTTATAAQTKAYVAPPTTAPVTAPSQSAPSQEAYKPAKTNAAATSLVSIADAKIKGGQYDQAAASLERALRHDAKNADIWSKLAEVRLLQQDYSQAESTALKSNALSNGNRPLMSKNWRLISKTRRLRGDAQGADEAEVRAYQLSK